MAVFLSSKYSIDCPDGVCKNDDDDGCGHPQTERSLHFGGTGVAQFSRAEARRAVHRVRVADPGQEDQLSQENWLHPRKDERHTREVLLVFDWLYCAAYLRNTFQLLIDVSHTIDVAQELHISIYSRWPSRHTSSAHGRPRRTLLHVTTEDFGDSQQLSTFVCVTCTAGATLSILTSCQLFSTFMMSLSSPS